MGIEREEFVTLRQLVVELQNRVAALEQKEQGEADRCTKLSGSRGPLIDLEARSLATQTPAACSGREDVQVIQNEQGTSGSQETKQSSEHGRAAQVQPTTGPALPHAVPMATTRVVMHQIILPSEVDNLGICFGGQVLSWIDVCAGMSAKTLAKASCVTASVDAVHFIRPCRLGTVAIVAAQVNRTFNSSMEVGVRVESEDMRTGARYHCCSAYLTFVVVPDRARPQQPPVKLQPADPLKQQQQRPSLPRVIPSTKSNEQTFEAAQARRQARLSARAESRSNPTATASAELCRLQPITHREGGAVLPPSITLPAPSGAPLTSTKDPFNFAWPGMPMPHTPSSQELPDPYVQGSCLHSNSIPDVDIGGSLMSSGSMEVGGLGSKLRSKSMSAVDFRISSRRLSSSGVAPESSSGRDGEGADGIAASHSTGMPDGEGRNGLASRGRSMATGLDHMCIIPSYTVAYVTQSIMPQHANTLGITFGGQVMSWMEQCAYISASRLRASHILTAAMDSVSFVKSTKVGDIMYVTSLVTAIFMSSLEVLVSVHGEDPQVGELFHCADAFITLVTVSSDCAKPVQLPFRLKPVSEVEELRQEGAIHRRVARLKMRAECSKSSDSGHASRDGSTLPQCPHIRGLSPVNSAR